MKRVQRPNSELIGDVVQLLEQGTRVTLRVKGNSMLPTIKGEKYSVELEMAESYVVSDIVLAEVKPDSYVIHRVVEIVGRDVVLMGDGNIKGIERCTLDNIKAKVIAIIDSKGRRRECTAKGQMRFFKFWRALKPIRRYILAIYRRII